jgi:hypothetical protein
MTYTTNSCPTKLLYFHIQWWILYIVLTPEEFFLFKIAKCTSFCYVLIQQLYTLSWYHICHWTYSYGTKIHLVFFFCHLISNKTVDMDHNFQNLYKLRAAARRRRTNLHFMPHNFTRSQANTTYFNWKEQLIYWRIEWIFPQADNIKCVGRR